MGGSHAHAHSDSGGEGAPRAVRAVLAVIVPLAVVTLAALIWMWPDEPKPAGSSGGQSVQMSRVTGSVAGVDLRPCPKPSQEGTFPGDWLPPPTQNRPADPAKCGTARVELTSGPQKGQTVVVDLPNGPGSLTYEAGDDVILLHMAEGESNPYQLTDHDRTNALWIVALAFVLAVVAFGRWRGLTALFGLVVTFALLLKFLIPAILDGSPPLLAAIVCAAAIMLTVLYLTHGLSMATSIAVIGTLSSLALTGVFATVAMGMAHLSGISDESSLNLGLSYDVNLQGLLLASIIIGSLGVLDDVTVTQAVTVTELANANPAYRFRQLYKAGTRVGRAHIASVINTIILAYAGASLPLLLLLSIGEQPLGQVLTGPILAQEIVRSVAGTLGLIAAVPITTALAALTVTRRPAADVTEAPVEPPRSRRTTRETETPPPGWPREPADPF
ncbi:YibE/F family protein [Thermomonospora umbrina]|uniref:Putative membrane protein n=1 Tax=Thermomonospora umbrina TaxID=111806 RepID=A0A3D9SXA5_9ACTN|nr:YibE/F family protein [Thermomonospora umbrina]REE97635.1 putative membrane protein [Thermomonospora umbrina]